MMALSTVSVYVHNVFATYQRAPTHWQFAYMHGHAGMLRGDHDIGYLISLLIHRLLVKMNIDKVIH